MAKKKRPKKKTPAKKAKGVKKPVKKAVRKSLPKKRVKKGVRATIAAFDTDRDVKVRIITCSPKEDVEPEDLTDEMLLKENLDYQDANFVALQISLDEYVNDQNSLKHVSPSDITNNKSVGAIVKMVKTKIG